MGSVTVAIPVRNGGAVLEQTLLAVRSQKIDASVPIQTLVCDSGSTDGSRSLARAVGADVFSIDPAEFSHGGTRNLLMERAEGDRVAFLTQDAVPADEQWLGRLFAAFDVADDVALAFGPYVPRPEASPMVVRELTEWFRSFSPDGSLRIDRLGAHEREIAVGALLGARGFFTDANGCVAKAAWGSVPFRPVAYAEDHVLAHDMLRAGFAKVYVPDAAVIHSHEYSRWDWLRRSFDEARAMNEVYGFDELGEWRRAALNMWWQVGADWRWSRSGCGVDQRSWPAVAQLSSSFWHHLFRTLGTMLGTRADRLPRAAVKRLSLEGRT